jgi:hypothetical protein
VTVRQWRQRPRQSPAGDATCVSLVVRRAPDGLSHKRRPVEDAPHRTQQPPIFVSTVIALAALLRLFQKIPLSTFPTILPIQPGPRAPCACDSKLLRSRACLTAAILADFMRLHLPSACCHVPVKSTVRLRRLAPLRVLAFGALPVLSVLVSG